MCGSAGGGPWLVFLQQFAIKEGDTSGTAFVSFISGSVAGEEKMIPSSASHLSAIFSELSGEWRVLTSN